MKSPNLAQSSNWLFTSFSLKPHSGSNGPLSTYSAVNVHTETVISCQSFYNY